jgi:hypothetical protein
VSVAHAAAHESLLPGQVYGAQLDGSFVGLPGLSRGSCVHVPGVALQVSQVPAHAVEQQTPSAQKPLWHWVPREHEELSPSSATQAPPLQ